MEGTAKAKRKAHRDKLRSTKQDNLMNEKSRLSQIVGWLGGPAGDGKDCLVILDECHKAKNLLDVGGACGSCSAFLYWGAPLPTCSLMLHAGNCTITGLAVEQLQLRLPQARVLYS